MAIREIRTMGDEVLTKKCKEVTAMTPRTMFLIEDMIDTMYANDGIGLAACQVGMLKQMVVYDVKYIDEKHPKKEPHVLPEVIDAIGNAEEYIRILRLQGNDIRAQEVQKKYEYFMNNRDRIPEMKQHINEGMSPEFKAEFEDIMRRIADGEEISFGNVDIPELEPDEGEIVYNGITISSWGNGFNQYGEIMMQISDEVIESIELAVEQGQLVLTDAQRQTLLKAKQKPKEQEVSEQDFREVAENSIGEKDTAFNALKIASQEPEKDSNIQSQGE